MTENRNFNDLYAFTQVVRQGNFSRAARALNVQSSALSHRIADLEKRLGTRLINRTTRAISLTEAGQQLFEHIAPMFDSIQRGVDALGEFSQRVAGKLRINSAENPVYHLLYPGLRSFLREYPDVSIEVLIDNNRVDTVTEGFDFGIRPINHVAQNMVAIQISGDRPMATVAAVDYLKQYGTPESPQALLQHHCIVPALDVFSRLTEWEYLQEGQVTRISVPARLIFNNTAMVKQAALDALGIAWLPRYAVEAEIRRGALVEVLQDQRVTYPPIALYYPRNRHRTLAAQALTRHLRMATTSMPGQDANVEESPFPTGPDVS